jgi:Predicted endonuclease distantly related to archaeal Holliday junction resolvase
MTDKKNKGNIGEKLAVTFLVERHYAILETNWRSGKKEIDIIARKDDVIVFVEVKTRSSIRFGMPEESVTPAKAEHIVQAAMHYLENKTFKDIRFDIISILIKKNKEPEIFHIKDAFY